VSEILQVHKFSKHYAKFSVQDISFELGKGTVAGLIGRNGAGKSTIIRGIMGLTKLDAGEVLIDGVPVVPFGAQIRNIGYVPDRPVFYEWMTVDQAIKFTSKFYPSWRAYLAEQLKDVFALRDDKRVKNLSAGMRTKLALLLAISHEPSLLILDEPTSGLDPIFRADLLEYLAGLRKSARNLSILFSSHILSDVELIADQTIILRGGRLVGIFKAGELESAWSLLVADERFEIPGRVTQKDWKPKNVFGRVALCILNREIDETLAGLSENQRRHVRVEHATTEEVLLGLI
jgi:ABC-2 type transport system ATP-binding protein